MVFRNMTKQMVGIRPNKRQSLIDENNQFIQRSEKIKTEAARQRRGYACIFSVATIFLVQRPCVTGREFFMMAGVARLDTKYTSVKETILVAWCHDFKF